jgi:branched-chain amino acid transport system permease protein
MTRVGKVSIVVLLVLAALLPFFDEDGFGLTVGTLVALNIIGAASLHLVIRTGHVSLAHAGFMGVGGYTAVLTLLKLGWPFPLNLLAGAAAAAIVALLIGPLLLRLQGKYFVLVTFMLGEILRLAFTQWTSLTGGANGIFDIPAPAPIFDSAAGFPVLNVKVAVFVLATALVGIQGGLTAHHLRYIDPGEFTAVQSLNFVAMNVIGGMKTLLGPIIGATFMATLPELLRGYVELQHIMFGIILIVVMAAMPGGVAYGLGRLKEISLRRFARHKAPAVLSKSAV